MSNATFPPTPTPAAAAVAGEVRSFRPDVDGAPPAGWAWKPGIVLSSEAGWSPGDSLEQQMPTFSQRLSNANVAFSVGGGSIQDADFASITFAWPEGWVPDRVIAFEAIANESGDYLTAVVVGAADTGDVCGQRYTRATTGDAFALAQSAFIFGEFPQPHQAFAKVGSTWLVRGTEYSGDLGLGTYLCINVDTGAFSALPAADDAAGIAVSRVVAGAPNGLSLAVFSEQSLARARHFTITAGVVSATGRVLAPSALLPASASAYNTAPVQPVLGFSPDGERVVAATAYGFFEASVGVDGTIASKQVAGLHALTDPRNAGSLAPYGLASFSSAWFLDGYVWFAPAEGDADATGVLYLDYNNLAAGFERKAVKL